MKYIFKILFCLSFWGLSTYLYAQNTSCSYSIQGKVYSSTQKQAIAGALVFIKGTNHQAITDAEGFFAIEHICTAECVLICQALGMQTTEVKFMLNQTKANSIIHLAERQEQLAEVEIKANKLLHSTQSVSELSQEMLDRNKGRAFAEALQEIAGINVLQTGPSLFKPIIQGLHSNRIAILNNGVKQEGQQWGLDHAPEIDGFNIAEMQVVKGAMAVRYGAEAMGGIIIANPLNIKYIDKLQAEWHSVIHTNNRMGAIGWRVASNIAKIKGLSWQIQNSLKKAGDSFAPNYNLSNTGFSELNLSATLAYHHPNQKQGIELYYSRFSTNLGILKATHIGNLNDFRQAISSPRPWFVQNFTYQLTTPRQQVSHDLVKLLLYKQWQNIGKLSFQHSWQYNQRREYDTRRGDLSQIPAMFLQLLTQQNELHFEHQKIGNWQGQVGVQINYQDNYNVPTTRSRVFIPDYQALDMGAYWIEKYVKPNFEIEAGIRYDKRLLQSFHRSFLGIDTTFNLRKNFDNLTANIGFAYFLPKNISFKTNIGKAWRPPAPNELFSFGLHHGAASIEYGNLDLQPETSYKLTTTLSQQQKRWAWEITAFGQVFQNFIYLQPNPQGNLTINGFYPVFEYKQTQALFRGIDATTTIDLTNHWTWRGKASLVQAYNTKDRQFLPFIPANRADNTLMYQWKHTPKTQKAYVALGHTWVAEQRRYTAESDFAPPPTSYHLWHIEMLWQQKIQEKYDWSIALTINNLWNISYRDYLNRFRYFADEVGRNLSLRLKVGF